MSTFRKPQGVVPFNLKQIETVLKRNGYMLLSQKFDGVRLRVSFKDGKVSLLSRTGKPFPALKDIEASMQKSGMLWLFDGVDIEGELVLKGPDGKELPCEETSGALQRKEQWTGGLNFYPVDCIFEGDLKEPLAQRLLRLSVCLHKGLREAMSRFNVLTVIQFRVSTVQAIMDYYEEFRIQGAEGVVVCDPMAPVKAGKVLGKWKIKPEDNREAIVLRVIEAVSEDKQPKGMIGSLYVRYEDGSEGYVGAGQMTHEERRWYFLHQDYVIGRMIEVKSMEETGKGGMRHPVFRMFRDSEDNKGHKV